MNLENRSVRAIEVTALSLFCTLKKFRMFFIWFRTGVPV